tara:strand:+ start:98 stop:1336 length:1239 start_codon:yes stop_codon:yes gene_type:complete
MSVFREHKSNVDRSATDRKRHKEKIEKAIKESIKDVVAEESIIGQNGKKKIKIPVKGIKEYRFVYGKNDKNKTVGSAGDINVKKGQKVGRSTANRISKGNKPSDKAGEEKYEVEISLEELASYLFDSLQLPELEKKRFKFINQEKLRRKGHRLQGIRSRLSKKETLKRKIKRKKQAIAAGTHDPDSGERFPFHKNDLKYHHVKPKNKENTAAVIFFIMDVSGSMDQDKKFLARSFCFLLYQFIRHKYENVEVVFIAHTTKAKQVNENEFFTRITSGGTIMSSALELEKELIEKQYHPSSWNIYTFYAGDGENWPSDIRKSTNILNEMKQFNQLIAYTEITPWDTNGWQDPNWPDSITKTPYHARRTNHNPMGISMWEELKLIEDSTLKRVKIVNTESIWPAFSRLFGGKTDG